MNTGFVVRLFVAMTFFGFLLYSYLDKQNEITELRIQIPELAKAIKQISEENARLKYEIEEFENPLHLIELSRNPKYSHLKHPVAGDVITLKEGKNLELSPKGDLAVQKVKSKLTFAIGAKH